MIETRSPSDGAFDVHHQRDMLEEGAEVGELAHRTDELLKVVETAGGVGRPLGLPHVDIAALLENELRQLLVRDLFSALPPAIETRPEGRAGSGADALSALPFPISMRAARVSETPARRPYSCKVASVASPSPRLG